VRITQLSSHRYFSECGSFERKLDKVKKTPLIDKRNLLFFKQKKKQNNYIDGARKIYGISWTSELGNDNICHRTWIRSVALFKSAHSGDVLARGRRAYD